MSSSFWFPTLLGALGGLALGLLVGVVLVRLRRPPAQPGAEPSAPAGRSRPLGWLLGGAIVVLLAGMGIWAVAPTLPPSRGEGISMPAPQAAPMAAPGPAASPAAVASAHGSDEELPPAVAAQIDSLRAKIQSSPGELGPAKQLAVLLLSAGRPVEAFEVADELLKKAPEDADGLFVSAQVRLEMGQWGRAADLFERVIAQHPDHVSALLGLGRAQSQLGQKAAAVASWERGLAAAGGHHAELEQLLASARSSAGVGS
ncbi:MAG: tetratricopeptide repeat protein [Thermoanaerobaculia bacterium]